MQINYKFLSDKEPTDEQLHLLMQEVAIEGKKKPGNLTRSNNNVISSGLPGVKPRNSETLKP